MSVLIGHEREETVIAVARRIPFFGSTIAGVDKHTNTMRKKYDN
ncbi:MAG TPA: hypothetical protein VF446_20195 [Trinickia sp.]